MLTNIISPPTVEPVTVAEAKSFLRVDISDDDTLIGNLITAARVRCETLTQRTFVTTTYDFIYDAFYDRFYGGGEITLRHLQVSPLFFPLLNVGVLEVPRPPLQSVTSITYLDTSGSTQTLSTNVYRVVTGNTEGAGKIVTKPNQVFPISYPQLASVTVRAVCGFGNAATDVPQVAKTAILFLVAHYYNHREAVSDTSMSEVPETACALLDTLAWGCYA